MGKPASQLVQGHKEGLIGFSLEILGLQTHPSTWPLGFDRSSQLLFRKQRLSPRRAIGKGERDSTKNTAEGASGSFKSDSMR